MKDGDDNPFFLQTNMGVVTQKGEWFHISPEQVDEFAPGLLDDHSFADLIKEAQAWVESASSLSLILLYTLLFFINPWLAAITTICFHFLWYQNKSAFIFKRIYKLFMVFNHTVFLFFMALGCLSAYAMQQQYIAAAVGLFFFIIMKPGLLRKAWNRLYSADKLSLNDRLLKMILVKHTLYTGGSSPKEIADIEERFAEIMAGFKRKNKNNS